MTRLPARTVHLDFHTGPAIDDVASNFKADEFAATFQQAAVQSVTVFAKCHHGHLYYETDRAERHPGLPKSLDLLGEQVDALHSVGIRAPIYLSLQVDEFAANTFPEWLAVADDLRAVKLSHGVFDPGWQVLDMSSPYADYFAAQLDDVLMHLGVVDGVFLDMCWDQPSASMWAISSMRAAGLDPADAGDRARHARTVAHRYMDRYQSMITPHLALDAPMSVWFNSRPKTALLDEIKYVSHVEIEALPTGGWGYGYFPYVARFVAPLGVPMLAHTGRFHKSWGDSGGLKPAAALKYECCQMLAHGVSAGVGDLLHPRGRLEPAAYQLIGDAFRHLARCEPFVADGHSVTEVAVLMDPALGDAPGPVGIGIVRALQQLRVQFTVLPPDADYSGVPLVIVPETTAMDSDGAARLDAYVHAGGRLLLAGAGGVSANGGALLESQGVDVEGMSPYSHTFLWDTAGDENQFAHVMYEPSLLVRARPGTEVLYESMDPYFERTWEHFSGHDYTPVDSHSGYAAVTACGPVVTFAAPIFTAYGRHGAIAYRDVLQRCLERLLPEPLLRIAGPAHLETTVVDTGVARVVHLLSFLASRQAEGTSPLTGSVEGIDVVHDPFPLLELSVSVRADRPFGHATLQPHDRPLAMQYADGYATVLVSIEDGHGMVVFER
jgi:putative glycosyl hydrolase-like family 6 (GHL6) protein